MGTETRNVIRVDTDKLKTFLNNLAGTQSDAEKCYILFAHAFELEENECLLLCGQSFCYRCLVIEKVIEKLKEDEKDEQ